MARMLSMAKYLVTYPDDEKSRRYFWFAQSSNANCEVNYSFTVTGNNIK